MSQQYVSPYINFQGRAREAMAFYQKALGGKVDLQTSDERGVPKPAGPGDRITHARLDGEGVRIVGTDGHPKYPAKVGENVAIALNGTDKARLTTSFNHLAEGGTIKMPLAEQGYLLDKFGINWVVSVDKT
jgi:PhnB protein